MAERGEMAGTAHLKDSIRLHVEEERRPEVSVRYIVENILQELLDFTPKSLLCMQDSQFRGLYDLTFYSSSDCYNFYQRFQENKGNPVLDGISMELLYAREEVSLILHMYNPFVDDTTIECFLSRYCKTVRMVRKLQNVFGIWNGKRQFLVTFKEDPDSPGGMKTPPASFTLGSDRGYLRFTGQPTFCRKCYTYGHIFEDCPGPRCRYCGSPEHQAFNCNNRSCDLCGDTSHLFRKCPMKHLYRSGSMHAQRPKFHSKEAEEDSAVPGPSNEVSRDGERDHTRQSKKVSTNTALDTAGKERATSMSKAVETMAPTPGAMGRRDGIDGFVKPQGSRTSIRRSDPVVEDSSGEPSRRRKSGGGLPDLRRETTGSPKDVPARSLAGTEGQERVWYREGVKQKIGSGGAQTPLHTDPNQGSQSGVFAGSRLSYKQALCKNVPKMRQVASSSPYRTVDYVPVDPRIRARSASVTTLVPVQSTDQPVQYIEQPPFSDDGCLSSICVTESATDAGSPGDSEGETLMRCSKDAWKEVHHKNKKSKKETIELMDTECKKKRGASERPRGENLQAKRRPQERLSGTPSLLFSETPKSCGDQAETDLSEDLMEEGEVSVSGLADMNKFENLPPDVGD